MLWKATDKRLEKLQTHIADEFKVGTFVTCQYGDGIYNIEGFYTYSSYYLRNYNQSHAGTMFANMIKIFNNDYSKCKRIKRVAQLRFIKNFNIGEITSSVVDFTVRAKHAEDFIRETLDNLNNLC